LTGPLFALALVVVAGFAWDATRRYVLAVVASRGHAVEQVAAVRAEMKQEAEARGRLEVAHSELLAQVKRLHARLPESPIVPKGGR